MFKFVWTVPTNQYSACASGCFWKLPPDWNSHLYRANSWGCAIPRDLVQIAFEWLDSNTFTQARYLHTIQCWGTIWELANTRYVIVYFYFNRMMNERWFSVTCISLGSEPMNEMKQQQVAWLAIGMILVVVGHDSQAHLMAGWVESNQPSLWVYTYSKPIEPTALTCWSSFQLISLA